VAGIFHIYVNLRWASEPMVGVAERDPAMVILATEVRVWARKGGVVVRGAKIARCVRARGLVVPPDLAMATEWNLVSDPIIVWGREGIHKLPILIR
jgi:hypothetical protein